jgi:hypothetical protein
MGGLLRASIVVAVLALLVAAGAQAADWELWTQSSPPWADQWCCLPTSPDTPGGGVEWATESDSTVFCLNVHQTLEKDGQTYKALQIFRDYTFAATVPADRWLLGPWMYLTDFSGTDLMSWAAFGINITSLEVDGQAVPVDPSMLVDLGLGAIPDLPACDVVWYPLDMRFTTLGPHTVAVTYEPAEFYNVAWPAGSPDDPSPEFEGRRVWMPEQVGDPVDGKIVLKYNLNVVPPETAVEPCSWGRVKAALQE